MNTRPLKLAQKGGKAKLTLKEVLAMGNTYNKPITPSIGSTAKDFDLSERDATRYAQQKAEKERIANIVTLNKEKEARRSKEEGTYMTLPDGSTKLYKDMDFREKGYVNGQSLRNKSRWDENSPEPTSWYNPAALLYGMSANIGEAPYVAKQTGSNLPYFTAIGTPLAVGALAGIGAKTTSGFINNFVNPLAGAGDLVNNLGNKYLPKVFKPLQRTTNLNLEELRRVYHNAERFLTTAEGRFLHKKGHGLRENYNTGRPNSDWGTDRWNVNNELPPPPPPKDWNHVGVSPPKDYYSDSYRSNFIDLRRPSRTQFTLENTVQTTVKPKLKNKSGLTKEETLEKALSKDKDLISKMSEEDFGNTVLKPNGEVVPYHQGSLESQFSGSQNVTSLSPKQYADEFNSKIELLNDIISKRNKSGVEYRVKSLSEDGRLTFHTPEQHLPVNLTDKQKANVEWFNRDPKDWVVNKAGLKKKGDIWKFSDEAGGAEYSSIEEAIKDAKQTLDELVTPKTISGNSVWDVRLNPGQWRGNVEDIANKEYFRSIPGLEMSNTTSGVFADNIARKGTGAYEAINEYLKKIDLGRVKPGFNSQTEFSRGAWENFVKSGRGVGYYANPTTIYGTMKAAIPAIGVGAGVALSQKQTGGIITDPEGYYNKDNQGKSVIIPSNRITMKDQKGKKKLPNKLWAFPNGDAPVLMEKGNDYFFPQSTNVLEVPATMQKGGKIQPLIVNNPNDKRLKASLEKLGNLDDGEYEGEHITPELINYLTSNGYKVDIL